MTDISPIRVRFDDLSADAALTTNEVGELLAVPPNTLDDYRQRGLPPPWFKIGHSVRYRVGALRDFLRGAETQEPTATATRARRAAVDGLDEPPERPGRRRTSRHASAAAFFANCISTEAWPFVLAEPEGRPLDAVETLGTQTEGPIEWLTTEQYADAWRDASTAMRATDDRAELRTVAGLDDDPPPLRRARPGGL